MSLTANEASTLPLLTRQQARLIITGSAVLILFIQVGLLLYIRNGLVPGFMGDRYTEANVVRAADYFTQNGFGKTVGLPNVLWSDRFSYEGTKGMPGTMDTDNGVYLHYPPLPDLIAGVMARLVGMNSIWIWRLPCIVLNAIAMIILVRMLIRVMGLDRAAILIAAPALTPMIWTFMNGLHFQGYASALWLVQFAVLLHAYWIRNKLAAADVAVLALLGFGQGWLSFDFVFVVVLLALPLWLMRRAEGVVLGRRSLWIAVLAPLAGFALSHLMHLAQVIVYFGGVRRAHRRLRSRRRPALARHRRNAVCCLARTNAVQIYLSHGRAERALLCLVSACHRAGRIDRAGAADGISTGRARRRVSGSGRLPPLMPPRCSVRWRSACSGCSSCRSMRGSITTSWAGTSFHSISAACSCSFAA